MQAVLLARQPQNPEALTKNVVGANGATEGRRASS